jgi:hypothetical protein
MPLCNGKLSFMFRLLASTFAFLLATSRDAAAESGDGRPPSWTVSTDWGILTGQRISEGKTYLDGNVVGGLALQVRRLRDNRLYILEGQTFFVGGMYSARAGFIAGWKIRDNYSEPLSSRRISSNMVEYTYKVSRDKVQGVHGLDFGVSVAAVPDHSLLVAELGYGFSAQHEVEFLALFDVANATPGFAIRANLRMGTRDFVLATRLGTHFYFDLDHPAALFVTLGFGYGGGFNWN